MRTALVCALAGVLLAADGDRLKSGLDLSLLDRSVRPQDDLYRFANGGWLDRAEIPSDRVTYGTFAELTERTELDLRAIIEALPGRTRMERQIRDLYASVMDEAAVEARGMAALQPQLDRIGAITSMKQLAEEAGRLSAMGVGGPFTAAAGVDARNPNRIVVQVMQGGTLLPERDYYLKDDDASKEIRRAYLDYLQTIFKLTNRPAYAAEARDVLDLETALARAQQPHAASRVTFEDDEAFTMHTLKKRIPGFDWAAWGKPQGFNNAARIVLGQPAFFRAFSERTQLTPIDTWKAWLAARYITASAPYASRALHDARFDFFGRVLSGQETPRPRWKQAVAHVTLYLGDAIGRLYVEKHFPDSSRKRVSELVEHMLEAFRQAVSEAEWMEPGTRRHALGKLARVQTRIGYPDVWRTYNRLDIRPDDLLGNVERAQKVENDYRMIRLLRRTEPAQWLIPPQTVNAMYLPWRNEMVLPAAILQPPLFDPDAEDAVNYGGIGAIIGHEVGHAFDQRGRMFDADGHAREWWSPADEQAFARRAQRLVDQFSSYTARIGVPVDGEATLGENIGDLGGLAVAVRAYQLSLRGKPSPVIDGFTGEQRLFLRWAQLWRTRTRDEYLRQTLLIHHHAPPQYRANGAVTNLDAFYNAFAVRKGDKLYLEPKKRVRIW